MNKKVIYLFLIIAFVFSSCGSNQSVSPTETEIPTATIKPTQTITLTLTPTPLGKSSGKILHITGKVDEEEGDDIFITDIGSLEQIQLTNNSNKKLSYYYPVASHNGQKLAYIMSKDTGVTYYGEPFLKNEIYIMNINGEENEKISNIQMYVGKTQIEDFLIEIFPFWSPDDKKLAFTSNRNSLIDNQNPEDLEIYTIDLETFEINQLTKAKGTSQHPSWSPDGQYITFMSDRDGDWDIYYMKSDGSGKDIKITNNISTDRFPSWSNDGEKIIYHSDRDGNLNLYLYNFETGEESQLTDYPSNEVTAKWSPDDSWIVYASDKDGDYDIYIMNIETKENLQITNNQVEDGVQNWIP